MTEQITAIEMEIDDRAAAADLDHPDEAAIVWLEDPTTLPYVRSAVMMCPFREKRPSRRYHFGRLVGYATLKPHVRWCNGFFRRRLFWVQPHDRCNQPDGTYRVGAPAEAVDPLTVAVGIAGKMTDRAWGGKRNRDIDNEPQAATRKGATHEQ